MRSDSFTSSFAQRHVDVNL